MAADTKEMQIDNEIEKFLNRGLMFTPGLNKQNLTEDVKEKKKEKKIKELIDSFGLKYTDYIKKKMKNPDQPATGSVGRSDVRPSDTTGLQTVNYPPDNQNVAQVVDFAGCIGGICSGGTRKNRKNRKKQRKSKKNYRKKRRNSAKSK